MAESPKATSNVFPSFIPILGSNAEFERVQAMEVPPRDFDARGTGVNGMPAALVLPATTSTAVIPGKPRSPTILVLPVQYSIFSPIGLVG